VNIDVGALTGSLKLGEVEFLERETTLTMDELAAGKYNTTAIIALIVIQERRSDPSFSMDDARAIPVEELEIVAPADPPKPKRRAAAVS
jgi:hypothetical protein